MNSLLIEPDLPFNNQKLTPLLQKIALSTRLDIDIHPIQNRANLPEHLEKILASSADTIIALGSFNWLDIIISESCRLTQIHKKPIPIFAHISPPEKLTATWRITPYMEHSLKRPLQAIAARKIIEKKAFVCADMIWFTHTLKLVNDTGISSAPARFTIATPQGSNLRIDAPVDAITISVHEDITNQDQNLVTVLAEKKYSSSTAVLNANKTKDNILEQQLRTKNIQKASEDIFHIHATKILTQAPYSFSSSVFSVDPIKNFQIEPSKVSIKMITGKNDILKY